MTDTLVDIMEIDMHEVVVWVRGDLEKVKAFKMSLGLAAVTEAQICGVELIGVHNVTLMEDEETHD